LDDPDIVSIFEQLPELGVLNLMSNPVISKIKNYRKTLISKCHQLAYLDDRPVFDKERLQVEAWAVGGIEAEREERQRQHEEDLKQQHDNFEAMLRMQQQAREKRLETYGPDTEPHFEPKLESMRDQMLERIQERNDFASPPAPKNVPKIVEITSDDQEKVPELEHFEMPQDDYESSHNGVQESKHSFLIQEIDQDLPEKSFVTEPNSESIQEESNEKETANYFATSNETLIVEDDLTFTYDKSKNLLEEINVEDGVNQSNAEDDASEPETFADYKYIMPPNQREANLSLLEELVTIQLDEESNIPLLKGIFI
jgi:hypothetical protein